MTEQIRIWWIDSTSSGVFEYIIYRDNIEIGRIIFGNIPEFFDNDINFNTNYKYVVQAVNSAGISTGEVLNVNLVNITTVTQELVINTTSTSPTWSPVSVINSGHALHWTVSGGVVIPEVIDDVPVFDMSSNTGTAVVTITSITQFKGLTELFLDNLEIASLDILKATELVKLSCKGDNLLSSLNISTLVDLEQLTFRTQQLTAIDTSNNIKLTSIWGYTNLLTDVDLATNVNLLLIYFYSNSLGSAVLDKIVNDLASHGLPNGDLRIVDNAGPLTYDSYDGYYALVDNGWDVDVPIAAPNSPTNLLVSFNSTVAIPTGIALSVVGTDIRTTWVDSTTVGVIGAKVFRDDVEIADVGIGVEVWDDDTALENVLYKYTVQGYTASTISNGEVSGVNTDTITIVPAPSISNYVFDGSGYMVDKATIPVMLDDIVIQSWVIRVKRTVNDHQHGILGNLNGNNVKIEVDAGDNKCDCQLSDDGTSSFTNGGVIIDGSWRILSLVYNGNTLRLYEDKIILKDNIDPDFIGRDPSRRMMLGACNLAGVPGWLIGEVSDAQFYGRDLTQPEVEALVDNLANIPAGLVANFAGQKGGTGGVAGDWTSEVGGYVLENSGSVTYN